MRTDLFVHETQGVSTTLGRKEKLRVVFAGKVAGTDGSTVILPALPQDADITDKQARIYRGYVDHEALHNRHTDMSVFKSLDQSTKTGRVVKAWLNAIEDMRIEGLGLREYAGMKDNISATAESANEGAVEHMNQAAITGQPLSLAVWGALAITWEGRRRNGLAVDSNESLMKRLPPDLQVRVGQWVDEIPSLTSTNDALAMAQRIVAQIKAEATPSGSGKGDFEAPEDAEPNPNGGGEPRKDERADGGGSGSSDSAADDDGTEDEDEDGDDDDAYGDDEYEDGDDEDSGHDNSDEDEDEDDDEGGAGADGDDGDDGDGDSAGGYGPPGGDEPLSAELQNGVNRAAKVIVEGTPGKYMVLSTQDDAWVEAGTTNGAAHFRHDEFMLNSGGTFEYGTYVEQSKGLVSVMRRKLERFVLAQQKVDWDGGRLSGRLDPRRLVAASRGTPTVYRQRTPAPALDTAVCMLVDLSGSMNSAPYGTSERKVVLANRIVIAMCQALETIGVAHAVYGFNNDKIDYADSSWDLIQQMDLARDWAHNFTEARFLYGRCDKIFMYNFKDFDHRLRDRRQQLGNLWRCVAGANSDADSILYAWSRLSRRRESRRIMIVLSDGEPASLGNGTDIDYLKDVVRTLEHRGYETVGIGIMTDAVKQFYPRHVVCHDLSQFAGQAMDLLAQLLLGKRVRVSVAA